MIRAPRVFGAAAAKIGKTKGEAAVGEARGAYFKSARPRPQKPGVNKKCEALAQGGLFHRLLMPARQSRVV